MDWTTPETVFEGLAAGARVVANNCCGTPTTLLGALNDHVTRTGTTVTLTSGLSFGDADLEPALRSGALRLRSWHVHGVQRRLARAGLVDYLPVRLGDVAEDVLPGTDVALVRVGPPDADGWCTFGPSASFSAALVEEAGTVLAEIADDLPTIPGAAAVHVSRIARAVRATGPAPDYRPAPPDELAAAVAAQVLGVLPEGAVLQFGIGVVGEALAQALAADGGAATSFGLVGMVSDAMVPFVEQVVAAGRGPVQVVEAMGGPELMAWARDNPAIEMVSSRRIHNPLALAELAPFVSVNSAIAVDLAGQVVSESVGGALLAGIGGSFDFFEGAHLSRGGLRVIALRSTTARGDSTIVSRLPAADPVTIPRHSVDVVVTEHGVARFTGHTLAERREQLLAIAAPEHRARLADPDTDSGPDSGSDPGPPRP